MKNIGLSVRQMEKEDIPFICDYWLNADPDFLVGMGVDLSKVPDRKELSKMLNTQIKSPLNEKASLAIIWLLKGQPVGHNNVNNIIFADRATMHLHLWEETYRRRGLGIQFLKQSIPLFFTYLELDEIYCEPYAKNPAPNKTLKKLGFTFLRTYRTIPGHLNFEQEVNQWILTKNDLMKWR